MKWFLSFTVFLMAAVLTACNSSSSSSTSYGGSTGRSASVVTESFSNNAEVTLAGKYQLPGPLDPLCTPSYDGPTPTAYMVYERNSVPTKLVVFAHGNGHNVADSWVPHMQRELRLTKTNGLVDENGKSTVAFVATDYRDNLGFPTLWGAHDTIAATLEALEQFRTVETVYLMGVSMGGAVSGTAIAETMNIRRLEEPSKPITKEDGTPLFDYWISAEGVSQLQETWTEASAVGASGSEFAQNAAEGIQRDVGGETGTPVECPLAYQRRSPAQNAALMQQAGIKAATIIHAVNDGLVPYNQGREMASALTTALIPTQFFTVLTTYSCPDAEGKDICAGTTGTSYTPVDENNTSDTTLAGHASESYAGHPVMATAFTNLQKMLAGTYNETVQYFECTVDPNFPEESCPVDQIQP